MVTAAVMAAEYLSLAAMGYEKQRPSAREYERQSTEK
jgi:hypothetical protein